MCENLLTLHIICTTVIPTAPNSISMNKLQLYISKSLRGFKSVRNINPSENVQRHIHDLRRALESLDYNPIEKYLFYLISYIDQGSFFTILRTIPDQPLDHLATTIFVPNGLIITREEMSEIVSRTTNMVSNPSVSADDINELHRLFSKEYPVKAVPPACVPSEGRDYGCCFYGCDTGRNLDDFFADNLYCPAFIDYAGILLVDAALGVESSAVDVSDIKPGPTVTLMPPADSSDGFVPHIFHHVFDRPFMVSQGSEVTIVWKRGGFEDKIQTVIVAADGMTVEPVSNSDCRKSLTPASFYITARASKAPVQGAVITVNGVEINEARPFTHDELKNADVVIRATGYLPFRGRLDLAATTQALIQLQEQHKIYRFEMPVKSSELGAPIHFEIHTKREFTDSPIEGYTLTDDIKEGAGRTNRLQYVASGALTSRRNIVISVVAALVAGFLLGWLMTGRNGTPKTDTAADTIPVMVEDIRTTPADQQAKATPAAQVPQPSAGKVTAEAISYLDNNTLWQREQLEQLGLNGLFDDMNNYRLRRIIDIWGVKLKASSRFAKVVDHARQSQNKKIFKAEGTYCKPGDNSIAVQTYLNRIDPAKKK